MAIAPSITTNLEFAIEHGESSVWQETARTTTATETDPIGSISDESGNGLYAEQGTTANKPTMGADAFEFDGSSDYLNIDSLAGVLSTGGSFSLYMVIDILTYANFDRIIDGKNGDGSDSWAIHLQNNGYRIVIKDAGSTANRTASDVFVSGVMVLSLTQSANNWDMWIDGVNIFSFSASRTPVITTLNLFSFNTGTAFFLNAELYGVYAYSTAHNDTDRGTIEDDLTSAFISSTQSLEPDTVLFTDTVGEPTIANASAQGLSPDTVSFTDTVNEPTIALVSTQSLEPDSVSFTDTVGEPTIANASAQSLAPDSVTFTDTVNEPTIALSSQSLAPDSVVFSDTVNEPTIANASAQSLSPDKVSFTDTINNVTIALGAAQSISPDTVVFTDTVNEPTIANYSPVDIESHSATMVITDTHTATMVITDTHTAIMVISDTHTAIMEVE